MIQSSRSGGPCWGWYGHGHGPVLQRHATGVRGATATRVISGVGITPPLLLEFMLTHLRGQFGDVVYFLF